MNKMLLIAMVLVMFTGLSGPVFGQDPPPDPFGGGFMIGKDVEIFGLGARNDSLYAWGLDWFNDQESILLVGEGSFSESYQVGEDRDIAAADFNNDFLDELVIAWNRSDGGVFVGIPTIDRETLMPDPAGWHVPDPPVAAGVLYAADTLSDVLGEIRVVAGNFYDDAAMEFVLAYLTADGTVSLTVYDVDSSSLAPEAKGSISDQAIHTGMPDVQKFGTASRFDVATGDLDNDGTDEIFLVASDPAYSPETDLMVDIYDYDTTGHTISLVAGHQIPANLNYPAVSCLRRIASTAGDFDADTLAEIAIIADWARTDQDTLHYANTHFLDFSSDMMAIERSWDWDSTGWAHLHPKQSFNNNVYALTVYHDELIAGGAFTADYDNTPTLNRVARWNGFAWEPMGRSMGVNSDVYALTVYNGDLFIGGNFDKTGGNLPLNYIARWDGQYLYQLGSGLSWRVRALNVYNGDLIVGGDFATASGTTVNRIARWDGSDWNPLGAGMNLPVHALTLYNGDLIAGGEFTSAGGQPANRIARWDGSNWSPLGSGFNGTVRALAVYNGDLYAAGDFTLAGGVPANRIARWDGSAWHRVGSGFNASAYALGVRSNGPQENAVLVAGGDMYSTVSGAEYWRIAYLLDFGGDGGDTVWASFAYGNAGVNGRVSAMLEYGNDLIIGGQFNALHPGTGGPDIPSYRIGRVKPGGLYNIGLFDTLNARCDFIVDIVSDDVDFAADSADEIIVRAYHDPSSWPKPQNPFWIYGVDSSFTGCYRVGNYPATGLWGTDGVFGSRRTMAVGNFVDDTSNYKDLLFLVADTVDAQGTIVQAFEIDTTRLIKCGNPEANYLVPQALWEDPFGSLTEMVAADIDSGTIILGKPTYYRKTDIVQPLVVLNAPPVHFDVLNNKADTVDLNFRYFENPDNCETFSVYQKKSGYTMEMSTQINNDWGVSRNMDMSAGGYGVEVKAHLNAEYGEQFSNTGATGETIQFTATVSTGDDDQIFATQVDYDIWEYPIIRNGAIMEGGGVLVVSPIVGGDIFSACKNPDREQFVPDHEVENVLSYPRYDILTDNPLVASQHVLTKGNTGFTMDDYPWSASWAVLQTDFSSEEVETEWKAGVDVGASVSASGSYFGFSYGVNVEVNLEYSHEEVETMKTTVTDACSLGVYLGCINTSLGVCKYTVTPYAYWANNGALVLDYITNPMVAGQGEDPTWWQNQYDERDPAFVLPWRLEDVKGRPLASEESRYKTREIMFHPDLPSPGEVVTITARVHNFGLEPIADPIGVSFYLGNPDNGGQLIYDAVSSESIFYTPGGLLPQCDTLVTARWQVPDAGSISGCQRIWAVIDPEDEISPEVHDNDDWATNNKGWKLLYVNTDDICIDRDGDGWEESAFRCHTCPHPQYSIGEKGDNCPTVANPDQADSDGDGIGNACEEVVYICGDPNGNGAVNILDVTYLISYLYKGGPAPVVEQSADVNNSGSINILDCTYLINYLYKGGPAPNCP